MLLTFENFCRLLMTGEVPSQAQVDGLIKDMNKRAPLPEWIEKTILSFPKDLHPMTQVCMMYICIYVRM